MKAALAALLLLAAAAPAAGADLADLVAKLRDGNEAAAEKLIALGKAARPAIPDLEKVMAERPTGGKGNLPQALLAARVLAALGEPGRIALAKALESENPQSIVAAAGEVAKLGANGVFFVPSLREALTVVPPRHIMMLHWHPWQPLYGRVPSAVIGALAAIGPGAKAAVPDLLALVKPPAGSPRAPPARQAFEALVAIVPADPRLPDLLAAAVANGAIYLANDDLSSLAPWLRERGDAAIPCLETILRKFAGFHQPTRAAAALLAARGKAAHGALVRLLRDAETPGNRRCLVEEMARAGTIPPAAVPIVASIYRKGLESGAERWTTLFLAKAGDAGEAAVMDAIGDRGWHEVPWRLLVEAAPPDFVVRLSRRWFAKHRSALLRDPFEAGADGGATRTRARGGGGGGSFEDVAPAGDRLVGLRAKLGPFADWRTIVRSVRAVFRAPDGTVSTGKRRGRDGRSEVEVVAKEGYAVGGILVRSGDRVDGFALVFLRIDGDRLDPEDAYLSPFVGGDRGGGARLLGGDGTPVAGIHGRSGADVDAIGLVAAE